MSATTTPDTDLRRAALADPQRPIAHFTSPAGWLNDPNGACQWGGTYHLFYQYNPSGAFHDRIHWGHAVSRDLVRWRDRPIALRPEDDGPDEDGCWSGVVVVDDGSPTIVYSGHRGDRQAACLAYGDAELETWRKAPENPVVSRPEGIAVTEFRDHCVWREDGRWRQLIGGGIRGRGGCAFLYESDDLVSWRELGPLVVGEAEPSAPSDPTWTGTTWECVDFFRLTSDGAGGAPDASSDDPHLMIFSAWHEGATLHPLVAGGRYRGDRFEIDAIQRLDLGGRHAYAPQTFLDERGRRILWSWMQEGRDERAQRAAGWSGAMAWPRELRLDRHGVVRQEPVAETETLRGRPLSWNDDVASRHADIVFRARLAHSSTITVSAFMSPDGQERTDATIARDADGDIRMSLDRSRASLDPDCDATPRSGDVPHAGETVDVRVVLDGSSIEVFVDGIALTARVYPARPDSERLRIDAAGGAAVSGLEGWHLLGIEQADRGTETALTRP